MSKQSASPESPCWSGGEDGFQSLQEALDETDEALPIPPEHERRRLWESRGANAVDRQINKA